jgi:hypothetical protein
MLVLDLSIAVLLVMSVAYLVVRIFRLPSPFDELGLRSPCDDKPPPQV